MYKFQWMGVEVAKGVKENAKRKMGKGRLRNPWVNEATRNGITAIYTKMHMREIPFCRRWSSMDQHVVDTAMAS